MINPLQSSIEATYIIKAKLHITAELQQAPVVASAGAEAAFVTLPEDIQTGDLLVAYGASSTGAYAAVPAGWDASRNGTYGGVRNQMIHKIAVGNEGGTSIQVIDNTGTNMACGVVVIRPTDDYSTFNVLESVIGLGGRSGSKNLDILSHVGSLPALVVTGHWSDAENTTPLWTGLAPDSVAKLADVPDLHIAVAFVEQADGPFSFEQSDGGMNAYTGALFNLG